MRSPAVALMPFMLMVAACQDGGSTLRPPGLSSAAPSAAPTASVAPADCPPAGATMRNTNGVEFAFLGRDPADAEVCVWTATGGTGPSRQIRGLVSATGDTARFHREGLRSLFPLGPGKSANYTSATSRGFWRLSWRVLGEQRVAVPAGQFDVWVVEYVEESSTGEFRGERMFYIDKATSTPIRVDSRVVRGNNAYTPSWQAVTFIRPAQ